MLLVCTFGILSWVNSEFVFMFELQWSVNSLTVVVF